MTADLDLRGRAAATALREVIDVTIDDAATTEALIAAMGGGVVVRAHDGSVAHHPGRRIAVAVAALVAAAAAVVALVFLVRDHQQPEPVVPPTSTVRATTTTVAVTTTTIDEATLGTLPTVGPEFGFSPYPPKVTLLSDGRVFRILGSFGGPTPMEALDPVTGRLDQLGSTVVARNLAAFVELPGERLLVVGGDYLPADSNGTSGPAPRPTAEILDLTTGVSASIGDVPGLDVNPSVVATLLDDGTALVIFGGETAMVFDPATNTFTPTTSQPGPVDTGPEPPSPALGVVTGLFPIGEGRVLVLSASPSVYDSVAGTFTDVSAPSDVAFFSASSPLADGRVLLVYGGCFETPTLDAQGLSEGHQPARTLVFDPGTSLFADGPNLPHCATSAALLPSGDVFVAGYWWKNTNEVRWSGVLDTTTGETRRTPAPNRTYGTAVTLRDGRVLLVAGKGQIWADIYDETGT